MPLSSAESGQVYLPLSPSGSTTSLEVMRHRFSRWTFKHWAAFGTAFLLAFLLLGHASYGSFSSVELVDPEAADQTEVVGVVPSVVEVPVNPPKPTYSEAILGPPTPKFRDNLRNGTRYLTSWLSAGFTNDVMTLGNMIYLARMTDRVAILPPLMSAIGVDATIMVSKVFDLPRLERELGHPVLEWPQVKDSHSTEVDSLGCWNIHQVNDLGSHGPRHSRNVFALNLDVSYTRAPETVKLIPGFPHDSHSSFWALAPLAFSDSRTKALASMPEIVTLPGERAGGVSLPDEQVLCYDYLYYVCTDVPFEYEYSVYPVWDVVLKHFRWTPEVESIGKDYLRLTLNIADGSDIPPYISIHARHGDFENWCSGVDRLSCFASLPTFAVRVAEVQQELRERKGIDVTHVIVTSDEQDPGWWQEVEAMGWLRMDHEKLNTAATHGDWYPVLLDSYVQSASLGFVGTDRSTFSILSGRRVRDWNDGAVRSVKWGQPDADSH